MLFIYFYKGNISIEFTWTAQFYRPAKNLYSFI